MTLGSGPVRRIVTGHRADGKAIHIKDESFDPQPLPDDGQNLKVSFPAKTSGCFSEAKSQLNVKVLYKTDNTPADNDEPFKDPMDVITPNMSLPNGSVLRIADFYPSNNPVGSSTHRFFCDAQTYLQMMHRTESVDYGILISGEMTQSVALLW